MVSIQKAGRNCHDTAKDFRPISLSSFCLKTLERLIDHYIRMNLEPSLLSGSQHAYCKGKSTETALHTIVRNLEDSILANEYTLAAFIDIEGAFNNVTASSIVKALVNKRVNPLVCKWVNNMLINRLVSSEVAGASTTRPVCKGTPQGWVLHTKLKSDCHSICR